MTSPWVSGTSARPAAAYDLPLIAASGTRTGTAWPPSGTATQAGTVALTAASTLTAPGVRAAAGGVALTALSTLTVSATRGAAGGVSLQAASTLAVVASAAAPGGANLTAASTLTVSATRSATGSVSLAAASELTASAVRTVLAQASLAATSALVAAATRAAAGQVPLTAVGTLTVQGQASSVVTLAASSTLTVEGRTQAAGAASLTATSTLLVEAHQSGPEGRTPVLLHQPQEIGKDIESGWRFSVGSDVNNAAIYGETALGRQFEIVDFGGGRHALVGLYKADGAQAVLFGFFFNVIDGVVTPLGVTGALPSSPQDSTNAWDHTANLQHVVVGGTAVIVLNGRSGPDSQPGTSKYKAIGIALGNDGAWGSPVTLLKESVIPGQESYPYGDRWQTDDAATSAGKRVRANPIHNGGGGSLNGEITSAPHQSGELVVVGDRVAFLRTFTTAKVGFHGDYTNWLMARTMQLSGNTLTPAAEWAEVSSSPYVSGSQAPLVQGGRKLDTTTVAVFDGMPCALGLSGSTVTLQHRLGTPRQYRAFGNAVRSGTDRFLYTSPGPPATWARFHWTGSQLVNEGAGNYVDPTSVFRRLNTTEQLRNPPRPNGVQWLVPYSENLPRSLYMLRGEDVSSVNSVLAGDSFRVHPELPAAEMIITQYTQRYYPTSQPNRWIACWMSVKIVNGAYVNRWNAQVIDFSPAPVLYVPRRLVTTANQGPARAAGDLVHTPRGRQQPSISFGSLGRAKRQRT